MRWQEERQLGHDDDHDRGDVDDRDNDNGHHGNRYDGNDTTTTTTSGTDTSAAAALGALASSGNCKSFADLGAAFSSALTGAGGDPQKEAQLFQQFVDQAPSDIKADMQVIADDFSKIADALKGVDLSSGKTPDPAALAKIAALQGSLDQQKLATAEQHITAWATANCHA